MSYVKFFESSNLPKWIDSNYISIVNVNVENLISYMELEKPYAFVTTDGKWKIKTITSGNWWAFHVYKTDNFYKNGVSPTYTFRSPCKSNKKDFYEVLKHFNCDDFKNTLDNVITHYSDDSNQGEHKISAYKDNVSNYSCTLFQPYSAAKNIGKYNEILPNENIDIELRRDDVSKMIVNGQIDKIILDDVSSDDIFNGKIVDPIKVLENDLIGNEHNFTKVEWKKSNGILYIHLTVHSFLSYNLILDESKFIIA